MTHLRGSADCEPSTVPAAARCGATEAAAPTAPKLLFLVTEDWFFCSHRMVIARAARDAGFAVVVATRVGGHGAQICAEGFALRPLVWRRRGDGVLGQVRAILAIARLYRAERPDIVHHVALKAIVFGAAARRLAFGFGRSAPAQVSAVMGLGAVVGPLVRSGWRSRPLRWALGFALRGGRVTVENPDDRIALMRTGIADAAVTLIPGSGIDTARFAPLPDPSPASPLKVALVARMLRSKGVPDAVAAVRRLRATRLPIELLLAGPTDPDNRDSLSEAELAALTAQPGVRWLGRVADVREVWRRAAIAVLPSTYGEGVPSALLEAAACGRPIVATDTAGCREAVRDGETGVLVPPGDVGALATALAALAGDPARRQAMGAAGRALLEREFSQERVAHDTLVLYRQALLERNAAAAAGTAR